MNKTQIVIYGDDQHAVEVRLEGETVWLNQGQMAELFGRERSVIAKHIRNAFKEGELEAEAVCAKFAHTAPDGKTYQVDFYNLDVIIFRWATGSNRCREHVSANGPPGFFANI